MIARLAPASLTKDIGALLAVATASHARAIAVLVLISLISFLPGSFNIPPVDRDEARFAQATKQMIESGDYIDIRFQDEVRYKKPVGIYWLQAGVVRAAEAVGIRDARSTIWLYRVPSLLGAIGAVVLIYWAALAFMTRRMAFLAGLMMATCVLLNIEARLAKTDAVLLMCCVAAMGVMARAYLFQSTGRDIPWRHAFLLWTALAAGILLKGPLILMVVGLAAFALVIADRSASWLMRLRPMVGVLWILLLVLPWFVAIMGRAGDSFLQELVGRDLIAKIFKGQETHGAPPGYYLALFWVTFWPAAPLAAVAAPAVWRHRREPPLRFLLAWIIPCWLVFELVVTKLPHYVLPLYPAIAILIAREIERRELSDNPHLTRFTVMWPIFMAVIPAAAVWLVLYHAEPVCLACLASRRGRTDFRVLCLAPLRCRRCRALLPARGGRHAVHDLCGARRRHSVDAAGVSERRPRRDYSWRRLPQSSDCRRGIPRAEPRVSDRHPDTVG